MLSQINPVVLEMGQIHLEGNLIPHSWFQHLKFRSGKSDLPAIVILSEIIYWYRPLHKEKNKLPHQKFSGDMFQSDAMYYANKFGLTKKQVRDALKRLEDGGYIRREYREIQTKGGFVLNERMFVEPILAKIREVTHQRATTIEPKKLNDPPSPTSDPPSLISDPPSLISDPPSLTSDPYTKITTQIATQTTTYKKIPTNLWVNSSKSKNSTIIGQTHDERSCEHVTKSHEARDETSHEGHTTKDTQLKETYLRTTTTTTGKLTTGEPSKVVVKDDSDKCTITDSNAIESLGWCQTDTTPSDTQTLPLVSESHPPSVTESPEGNPLKETQWKETHSRNINTTTTTTSKLTTGELPKSSSQDDFTPLTNALSSLEESTPTQHKKSVKKSIRKSKGVVAENDHGGSPEQLGVVVENNHGGSLERPKGNSLKETQWKETYLRNTTTTTSKLTTGETQKSSSQSNPTSLTNVSPSLQESTSTQQHVKNLHEAHVESTPEHVKNLHEAGVDSTHQGNPIKETQLRNTKLRNINTTTTTSKLTTGETLKSGYQNDHKKPTFTSSTTVESSQDNESRLIFDHALKDFSPEQQRRAYHLLKDIPTEDQQLVLDEFNSAFARGTLKSPWHYLSTLVKKYQTDELTATSELSDQRARRQSAHQRQQEIEACPYCDEQGTIYFVSPQGAAVTRCHHNAKQIVDYAIEQDAEITTARSGYKYPSRPEQQSPTSAEIQEAKAKLAAFMARRTVR